MAFSLSDRHHIVNYHYVEDPRPDFRGIHPVPPERFEREVAFMRSHGRIATVPEVAAAARAGGEETLFAITFDDGLEDQYQNAVPILRKHGAPATFFIITKTLDGKLPQTHKIHLLLSRSSVEELIDAANGFFAAHGLERYHIPKDRRVTDKRKLRDDIPTANFKETVNVLRGDEQERLLSFLVAALTLDEPALARELFMDREDIKNLADSGFEVGSHTHNHYALDLEPREIIESEIDAAHRILAAITGKEPSIFCGPHGGSSELVREVIALRGYTHAVTIGRRAVSADDDPLLLPRHDTNDLRDFMEARRET